MGFFELFDDGDVLGALLQAGATLLALGGVVLAGYEPFVGGFGSIVQVVDAVFIHGTKDSRYIHAMFAGQAVSAAGAI